MLAWSGRTRDGINTGRRLLLPHTLTALVECDFSAFWRELELECGAVTEDIRWLN